MAELFKRDKKIIDILEAVDKNDLLSVLCFGIRKGEKYPPSIRQFCLALHYYSPKAYRKIRKSFNNTLPNTRTIKLWYSNSDVSNEEGIAEKNMMRLEKIVLKYKEENNGQPFCCSLICDEIDIRQQISWDPHNGYTGMASEIPSESGNSDDDNGEPPSKKSKSNESSESTKPISTERTVNSNMAKQAIVYLLNGINVSFEFPVAYWLIRGLNKFQRKHLMKKVIKAVTLAGVKILNLTFDCHPCNAPMCELLGANLNVNDPNNFKTSIENPINGESILIFFDPCHIEKLIRNTLANKKIIYFEKNQKIKWDYIEELYKFSQENDFSVHKINKKHMQWKRNSMNVGIANETLSRSVADALQFLMGSGKKEFDGASCTIKFIRMVDRLFDIFNSKSIIKEDIYKRALNENNKDAVFSFLRSCIDCVQNLYVMEENKRSKTKKMKAILHSRNKAASRGIIINIKSLISIYANIVEEQKLITNIPTYCFQQDPIELFFSRTRARLRENTNPNALQLKGCFRMLQCNIKIEIPGTANCRLFDQDNILTNDRYFSNILIVSSRRPKISMQSLEEAYETHRNAILEDVVLLSEIEVSDPLLDACKKYSIIYTAATIEKKIKTSQFHCTECLNVLFENEKVADFLPSRSFGLPCRSTVDICSHVEKFVKLYDFRKSKVDYNFKVLYCVIFRSINFANVFPNSSFNCDMNHKYAFIKCIVEQYIAIKAAYISKKITLDHQKKICRNQLHKLTLHRGQ